MALVKLLSALVAGLWVGWCYVTHGRAAVPARAQVTHISAARRARAVDVRSGRLVHLSAERRLRRRGPYRC